MVPGETVGQVISRADAALYQGKHAGRNRAMASGQATLSQVT
jgi:PleD family two-component response regulator